MTSLNGDITIYRNGKSTSKVSIYDYPEHLNPFYKDENHKRLRFWKIGKNKHGSGKEGRRNSFSIGGLKEMWAFKSFRLKKKSSTLGINKTSESPPVFRKDQMANTSQTNYGTYDPRMRHTTELNAFQRNVPYRSSLQDMSSSTPSQNNIGFTRNDGYRSTIQTPSRMNSSLSSSSLQRRYIYGGSKTPQPNRANNGYYNGDSKYLNHGASQFSVASSTNPFEDDDDDVVIGELDKTTSSGDTSKSTPTRHIRKKRRAPPPPIPVSEVIKEETSSNLSTPVHQNVLNSSQIDAQVNITNLTSEIENYVKSSSNTDERPTNVVTTNSPETNKKSNITQSNSITVKESNADKSAVLRRSSQPCSKSIEQNDALSISRRKSQSANLTVENGPKIQSDTFNYIESRTDDEKISNIIETNFTVATSSKLAQRKSNTSNTELALNNSSQNVKPNTLAEVNTKKSMPPFPKPRRTKEVTPDKNLTNIDLKITESFDDLSSAEDRSHRSHYLKEYHTQVRYIPLKESSPAASDDGRHCQRLSSSPVPLIVKNNSIEKFDESDDLPPQKFERKRSVREIIESINRSQQLLKINKDENNLGSPTLKTKYDFEPTKTYGGNTSSIGNLTITEKQLKERSNELDRIRTNDNDLNNNVDDDDEKEVEREFAGIIEKLSHQLNDNNTEQIFKKCPPQRQSSPTKSNLDWNPLPKPKRTKKLSPILNNDSSDGSSLSGEGNSPVKFNERFIE